MPYVFLKMAVTKSTEFMDRSIKQQPGVQNRHPWCVFKRQKSGFHGVIFCSHFSNTVIFQLNPVVPVCITEFSRVYLGGSSYGTFVCSRIFLLKSLMTPWVSQGDMWIIGVHLLLGFVNGLFFGWWWMGKKSHGIFGWQVSTLGDAHLPGVQWWHRNLKKILVELFYKHLGTILCSYS